MAQKAFDYVVVGAGIVGVNIAQVLKTRFPAASICVVDKEAAVGRHASGRNSGVLHAGFYYAQGSLKAKLTAAGNRFLTDYCTRKGIFLNRCGKLVVARPGRPEDQTGLDTLLSRASVNGVTVEEVTAARAKELEPLAVTDRRALWSPTTSAADPGEVLAAQQQDLHAGGVELRLGQAPVRGLRVEGHCPTGTRHCVVSLADGSTLSAGHVVNCAGLYADKLAHSLRFAPSLELLPFKGLYLYCTVPLQRLVYPVPDLGQPFLGVHFTVTADGKSKIGPTAIPALWREQYGDEPGLSGFLHGMNLREAARIVGLELAMFLTQPSFRDLALAEVAKYSRARMSAGAAELVPSATLNTFTKYGRAGIRAQLVRTSDLTLVQDYVLVGDRHSTHVLNAVSPAWTSSRPFAELVVDGMAQGAIPAVSPLEGPR